MDKDSLIKLALGAVAAYLVYRYLQSAGYLGAAPATAGTALPVEDVGLTPSGATPPTTVAAPAVTAAGIAASLTAAPGFSYWGVNGEGGNTQSGHHWNYYWKLCSLYNGQDAAPGELGVADDYQMTLSDYSNRVYKLLFAPEGVAGFDRAALGRLMSAWS